MAVFSVRVPDDLAVRFDAAAAVAGGRSALVRRLIQGAASAADGASVSRPLLRDGARLMVRLAPAEAMAVAEAATAMGLRRSSWVAALVRARVRGRPTFTPPQELSLIAVQAEIRRIGVNVNQIARALNTAVLEGRVLDTELGAIDDLRVELRGHLLGLREAFAGNLAYWEVGP